MKIVRIYRQSWLKNNEKNIYKNCREKKAKEENLKIRWLAGEGQAKGMKEE